MRLPCGHEVIETSGTHYCDYLRLGDLLRLQPAPAQLGHHDELMFIVVHQTFELWFKLILAELDRVVELIQGDDAWYAAHLIRRVATIVRLFPVELGILETMSPPDFFEFRDHLAPASGLESQQFREIEILSGLRDPDYRKFLELEPRPGPEEPKVRVWVDRLAERWEQPSLRDVFQALLQRRGVTATELYRLSGQPNPHPDLLALAEALLDYDEAFALFRFAHARMAERMLGPKLKGTGYTSGVRYLDYAVGRPHFFPELWQARSDLWNRKQELLI